jgi:hypothetical protein
MRDLQKNSRGESIVGKEFQWLKRRETSETQAGNFRIWKPVRENWWGTEGQEE